MTNDEIAEAISFNVNQPFTEDELKLIQETTGSLPDGEWGPRELPRGPQRLHRDAPQGVGRG